MEIKNVQANNLTTDYLNFCLSRKNLDQKTIKSYTIDLRQYFEFTMNLLLNGQTKNPLSNTLIYCIASTNLKVLSVKLLR